MRSGEDFSVTPQELLVFSCQLVWCETHSCPWQPHAAVCMGPTCEWRSNCNWCLMTIKKLQRMSLRCGYERVCVHTSSLTIQADPEPDQRTLDQIRASAISGGFRRRSQGRCQRRLLLVDSLFMVWRAPPGALMMSGDLIQLNVSADGSLAGCLKGEFITWTVSHNQTG